MFRVWESPQLGERPHTLVVGNFHRGSASTTALCPPPWTPAPWECIPPSAPESLEGILATDEPHHCVRGFSSALQLNVIPFAHTLTQPNPSGITFPLECECPSLSASRNTSQVGWHLPASSILTWKVGFQRQSLLTLKGGVHHLASEAGFRLTTIPPASRGCVPFHPRSPIITSLDHYLKHSFDERKV